jgi:hypothetical protein
VYPRKRFNFPVSFHPPKRYPNLIPKKLFSSPNFLSPEYIVFIPILSSLFYYALKVIFSQFLSIFETSMPFLSILYRFLTPYGALMLFFSNFCHFWLNSSKIDRNGPKVKKARRLEKMTKINRIG